MKVKKIQERKGINLKLQNKKKQKLKEKGITLIALVVTIIILLILVGVTLNMALSGDGLFSRAKNAADKYKKAQKDEQDLISEIGKEMNSEYVGAYVEGYTPTRGTCKIIAAKSGISSDQTIETSNEGQLKWRIWDYDGTTLRIILDGTTTQKLELKGAAGYNNGVWAINEVCRQCFGNKEMKEISVANLRRSDIQEVSTYDYSNWSHGADDWRESTEENDKNIKLGFAKSYSNENTDYPTMWLLNDKKWTYEFKNKRGVGDDKECLIWENEGVELKILNDTEKGSNDEILKQSGYDHDYSNKQNEFKDKLYYSLIFEKEDKNSQCGNYWLAGRCVTLYGSSYDFDMQYIVSHDNECSVTGIGLFNPNKER